MINETKKDILSALNKLTENLEGLTSRLDKLEASNKDKFKSIQNSLDLLYADRDILERVSGKVTGLEEQWKEHRTHIDNMGKDINLNVTEVKAKVSDKVNEIKEVVNDNIGAVVDSIDSKKQVFYVKEGFFTAMKRLFTKNLSNIKREVNG